MLLAAIAVLVSALGLAMVLATVAGAVVVLRRWLNSGKRHRRRILGV